MQYWDNVYSILSSFHDPIIQTYFPIGGIVLAIFALIYVLYLVIRIILIWKHIHSQYVVFEVKPLKTTIQV